MKISKLLLSTSLLCLTMGFGHSVQAEKEKSTYTYKETKVTTTQVPQVSKNDYTIRKNLDKKIDSMRELDDDLNFKVHNGVVTLSGTMDNFSERDLAVRVAKDIEGVVSVEDRMAVES